jgi:DNA-binding transcriptional ArsR family regulator
VAQKEKRELPPEVISTLAPNQCRALDHSTRRQILRALTHDADRLTLVDLSEAIPDASISTIGYHLLILEESGMVSVSRVLTAPGGTERGFASTIADNQTVAAALGAMLALDILDG